MKITKAQLKQIIKEEMEVTYEAGFRGNSYEDYVNEAVDIFRAFVATVGNVPMAIEAMQMAFEAAQGKPYISKESKKKTIWKLPRPNLDRLSKKNLVTIYQIYTSGVQPAPNVNQRRKKQNGGKEDENDRNAA